MYVIIPITVEFVSFDINISKFSIADITPVFVLDTVQPSMNI